MVRVDAPNAEPAREQVDVRALELLGEVLNNLVGILGHQLHLPQVALAGEVALEAVLVAALLLAALTVPPQLLQTLRLDPVADGFRCQEAVLGHG